MNSSTCVSMSMLLAGASWLSVALQGEKSGDEGSASYSCVHSNKLLALPHNSMAYLTLRTEPVTPDAEKGCLNRWLARRLHGRCCSACIALAKWFYHSRIVDILPAAVLTKQHGYNKPGISWLCVLCVS